jgi:hypothetical protein
LRESAVGVSASRRTDIPAFFGAWFSRRLEEGFAEYIPAGPPRRVRRSLRPEDVTHFNFWTKWPRPFFPALEEVLRRGYPVLWNVTVSGLGGTEVEPHVPPAAMVVEALVELSRMAPPASIQWRYDPVFVTGRYDAEHHARTFRDLAGRLAGHVDRVACSYVVEYGRRVKPDLKLYQAQTGDAAPAMAEAEKAELMGRLAGIARSAGIRFTLCCQPALARELNVPASGCNSWEWACRVYPALAGHRRLKPRPTRDGCACSEEIDIGVYDTCPHGCRYSYGSADYVRALANFRRHDPGAPCILP